MLSHLQVPLACCSLHTCGTQHSLSSSAHCKLRGVPAEVGKPVLEASVALMPRSLLVFKDHAYTSCMHGIDAVGVRSTS